jgi:hypothetical protein
MDKNDKNPEHILSEAIKVTDPAEQQAYLDRACEGDEALRAEMASLLVGPIS